MSSPVIDFNGICNALAARFLAAAIGTPTGLTAMRASYAQPPKGVAAFPCHLLEVQEGSVVANPGQWKHEMQIDGLLLLAKRPGDTQRVETLRQKWLPFLLHATVDQAKITLGSASGYTVDKVLPTGWEWTEYAVGASEYHAIRVHWTVYLTETVALTA